MVTLAIDYRDTIELLQYKLINYIRLNPSLNKNIRYKTRFIINTEQAINLNFIEFSEAYRAKYVNGKLEEYCLSFIEFLKPLLRNFLNEIRYGAFTFRVRVLYLNESYEKIFTVLNEEEDGTSLA